jgi:hypothetical protein
MVTGMIPDNEEAREYAERESPSFPFAGIIRIRF